MKAAPIQCQMFPDLGDDFWAHGAGAFCWGTAKSPEDDGSHLVLWLLVPNLENGQPKPPVPSATVLCLYIDHHTNDWAHPGPVKGWNGNKVRPTLTPSIQVLNDGEPTGWHRFLTAGKLYEA